VTVIRYSKVRLRTLILRHKRFTTLAGVRFWTCLSVAAAVIPTTEEHFQNPEVLSHEEGRGRKRKREREREKEAPRPQSASRRSSLPSPPSTQSPPPNPGLPRVLTPRACKSKATEYPARGQIIGRLPIVDGACRQKWVNRDGAGANMPVDVRERV